MTYGTVPIKSSMSKNTLFLTSNLLQLMKSMVSYLKL